MCFSTKSPVTGGHGSKSMGGLHGAISLTVKTQVKCCDMSCWLKAFLLDRIAHDPTTLRDVCVLPQINFHMSPKCPSGFEGAPESASGGPSSYKGGTYLRNAPLMQRPQQSRKNHPKVAQLLYCCKFSEVCFFTKCIRARPGAGLLQIRVEQGWEPPSEFPLIQGPQM